MIIDDLSKQVKNSEILKSITPEMAVKMLKDGNQRFLEKDPIERDHHWHIKETIDSQHPFAIVLGCIDSRVEPSIIFDQGIGDLFIVRIAGNIINQDILGSMEYACSVIGSKLVVVLGHSSCGAVKGAIDGVVLDNLTPSLKHIQLAVEKANSVIEPENLRVSTNADYVNAVAQKNIELSIDDIKKQSPILRKLHENGDIGIVGAFYDHSTGNITFDETTL